jgi:catechol 2,3-dioxygenase-like lactoylglutathione lyase family enzyme
MSLHTAIPVLHVSRSVDAEAFYAKLGFTQAFAYRPDETKDPCYMGFIRDGVQFHVSSFPGDGVAGGVVAFLVDDVDALHAEFVGRGVEIHLPPTDQTWGNREMYVTDPDGNSVRFVIER